MSIEQARAVDAIGVDRESGVVVLTIIDHLPWEGGDENHLLLLQEKINTYLRFIQSGEIYREYPQSIGRDLLVCVAAKYPLSGSAESFYRTAASVVGHAGADFRFRLVDDDA